jgi:hypothetical protein
MRRHPPHHLSPARANHPAGQDPGARLSLPSHHSNAPIKPESQSILSKIVAHFPQSLKAQHSGESARNASLSTAMAPDLLRELENRPDVPRVYLAPMLRIITRGLCFAERGKFSALCLARFRDIADPAIASLYLRSAFAMVECESGRT